MEPVAAPQDVLEHAPSLARGPASARALARPLSIALVTTPLDGRSGIADYTRHLLPYLRREARVDLYVDDAHAGTGDDGERLRPASALGRGAHDRILFQLGNERRHAFMVPLLQRHGGVVVLHDWVLFDLAVATWPELARGGVRGHLLALREGGLGATQRYARHWLDRTRRSARGDAPRCERASLADGWHACEGAGRWAGARATIALGAEDVRRVRFALHTVPGRAVELRHGRSSSNLCARGGDEVLELELAFPGGVLELRTHPVAPTAEQLANGDTRELGTFVNAIEYETPGGWERLDLARAAMPAAPVPDLSRARFELAFNRSVLHAAEGFLVHSDELRRRIAGVRRGARIGVVHHGAERRWREGDRSEARAELGLDAGWRDGFLCVSLGALQRHKRLDRLLDGFARARRVAGDLKLALVGPVVREDVDVEALVRRHGLEDGVRVTGWLPEERSVAFLRAADLCVNLRGPSTGGTSGGIFQALSLGRAVVASDLAEQRELPEACVVRVAQDEREPERIAEALLRLRGAPELRDRMERAARAFVDRECHWSHVARRYVELLAAFPAPRPAGASRRTTAA